MGENSQGRARMKNKKHGGRITKNIIITAMPEKATRNHRYIVCLTFLPFRRRAKLQVPKYMARDANAILKIHVYI
eukprot:7234153-Pyramimonas_sp.AAC.1